MVSEAVCTCQLYGERFSPKLVAQITGLAFSQQNEVGEVGGQGRYRGVALPYGAATIAVPNSVDEEEAILWLAQRLGPHIHLLRDGGADDIWINVALRHEGTWNWALSEKELKALAGLGLHLKFSAQENG